MKPTLLIVGNCLSVISLMFLKLYFWKSIILAPSLLLTSPKHRFYCLQQLSRCQSYSKNSILVTCSTTTASTTTTTTTTTSTTPSSSNSRWRQMVHNRNHCNFSASSCWASLWPIPIHQKEEIIQKRLLAYLKRIGQRGITRGRKEKKVCR